MKNIKLLALFEEYFLLERLTKLKDPMVKLEEHIDWDIFIDITRRSAKYWASPREVVLNLKKSVYFFNNR